MSARCAYRFQPNQNHEHQDLIRLIRLVVPVGEPIALAHGFIQNFIAQSHDGAQLETEIFNIVANPRAFFADELRTPLARALYRPVCAG